MTKCSTYDDMIGQYRSKEEVICKGVPEEYVDGTSSNDMDDCCSLYVDLTIRNFSNLNNIAHN